MKRFSILCLAVIFLGEGFFSGAARGYVVGHTVPNVGGCPQTNRQDFSSPVRRQWSTSLPGPSALLTTAAPGSAAQLDEVEAVIAQAYGVWTGVAGTTVNAATNPNAFAPLTRTAVTNACTNDSGTSVDGLDSICFNEASGAFATGVLAFTRTAVAAAPGATAGQAGPAAFAGQILDADIFFRNDGQATFATPGALATPQGQGDYDLESLLVHELGHVFGLEHSGIWRAMMFPFAPPPGQFLSDRATPQTPDAPLADDDRAGLRVLYPDPSDTVHVGSISGRILPANRFSLALEPFPSNGQSVTGIFGAEVVALDADTGVVVAGALGGWSCNANTPPTRFDGSYQIDRLPVGKNYKIYVEPLDGLAQPGDFATVTGALCRADVTPACVSPAVNTEFSVRVRPPSP
jgi:Matrixin